MSNFFKDLLKDKSGLYSLREVVIAIGMALVVISWMAQLLFDVATPEYMFYSVVSLVAAGCFGYSIERKSPNNPN
jgi:hypothetical protein